MRKVLLVLLALVFVGVGFFVALLAPVDKDNVYRVTFFVDAGDGVRVIARDLEQLGLVRNADALTLLASIRGQARSLQAGPYEAASNEWAWTVLDRLARGDIRDTTITIREGLWMTEIAQLAGPWVAGGADSFLAAARDTLLAREYGPDSGGLEGYLFPNTYRISPGGSARVLVRRMAGTFRELWGREFAARAESLGVEPHEAVTLASIVEAEAAVGRERARIAAVYWNRLNRQRPLQADPTVIYALGERRSRLLYGDLETDSPYNTYLVAGLPPGPIGNPGEGALRAVLWPEPECRDLYFVARGDGTHLFGRTFEEHQANRRRVQRERRNTEETP